MNRLLNLLKSLTNCQFVELTVEEKIELKTVQKIRSIKSTPLPIVTN